MDFDEALNQARLLARGKGEYVFMSENEQGLWYFHLTSSHLDELAVSPTGKVNTRFYANLPGA